VSIHAALSLLLEEYAQARSQAFAKNAMADMLRVDIPKEIAEAVANDARYEVDGSPGKGNWADVPWVAVLDRLVTETAQQGYYLVYLANEDCSGVYLSLNQGVTTVRQQYGVSTKKALATRAKDFLARLGALAKGLTCGPIDLGVKRGLGADYQQGSICSVFYTRDNLPTEEALNADLQRFLGLYRHLVENESSLYLRADTEDDEGGLEPEKLKRLREHKRIERNRKLAAKVKRLQGYTCKACGFNFEKAYGAIGADFIEAHHLTPLSELRGDVVLLDPKRDFSVLCSNCHRMIHRSEFVNRVEEFRAKYVVKVEA
jgi:5-methylcytosine-specific restriction protein A